MNMTLAISSASMSAIGIAACVAACGGATSAPAPTESTERASAPIADDSSQGDGWSQWAFDA